MRIEHLVFCLVLAKEVSSIDHELQKRVDVFMQTVLKSDLYSRRAPTVNLNRLRLCYCSSEVGCHSRTAGWIPGLGITNITDEQLSLYNNTCVTDGDCYQRVGPEKGASIFGCMDALAHTDETAFHDQAAKICANITTSTQSTFWVCCNNQHFCANETTISLPPDYNPVLPSNSNLPLVGILVLIFVIIISAIFYKYKMIWMIPLQKLNWIPNNKARRLRDVETNSDGTTADNISAETRSNDLAMNTLSTSIATNTTRGPPLELQFQEPNHPLSKTINMLKILEESSESDSGSGTGPTRLHNLTMGLQITDLELCGAGRFGSVFRGKYKGEFVAVKIFKSGDEGAFKKEVDIYETRMLRHPNVLRYIGSDGVDKNFSIEMWLVTEYHYRGSLYDFLKTTVIDLETFFKLMASATNGLNFLHTPTKGTTSSSKAAIAHRDIKSRNLIVKHDLTCAIGDLGLSLCQPEDKAIPEAVSQNFKCGTVRYLAPEILNGSMQSTTFESYLHADIYAQSLVVWETLSRVEEYQIIAKNSDEIIPYGEWTQREPSDEQMYQVVCVEKRRPTHSETWHNYEIFRMLMEFLNTCWSENPNARLNAYKCKKLLEEKHEEHKEVLRKRNQVANNSQPKPENGQKPKEPEMIPLKTFAPRKNQVFDQEMVENRNGHYTGPDDAKNPLLG